MKKEGYKMYKTHTLGRKYTEQSYYSKEFRKAKFQTSI